MNNTRHGSKRDYDGVHSLSDPESPDDSNSDKFHSSSNNCSSSNVTYHFHHQLRHHPLWPTPLGLWFELGEQFLCLK